MMEVAQIAGKAGVVKFLDFDNGNRSLLRFLLLLLLQLEFR